MVPVRTPWKSCGEDLDVQLALGLLGRQGGEPLGRLVRRLVGRRDMTQTDGDLLDASGSGRGLPSSGRLLPDSYQSRSGAGGQGGQRAAAADLAVEPMTWRFAVAHHFLLLLFVRFTC
jgi:hypothetical protein